MVVDAGSVVVHIFQGEEWRREVSWGEGQHVHVHGSAGTLLVQRMGVDGGMWLETAHLTRG